MCPSFLRDLRHTGAQRSLQLPAGCLKDVAIFSALRHNNATSLPGRALVHVFIITSAVYVTGKPLKHWKKELNSLATQVAEEFVTCFKTIKALNNAFSSFNGKLEENKKCFLLVQE